MARRKVPAKPGPFILHAELLREHIENPDAFPFTLPTVRNLEKLPFHPKVTFFVGENGSGKSTMLEAIAVGMGLNPEGGSRNFNFSTRASHSILEKSLRLSKHYHLPSDSFFLRAESYFNLATEIERLDSEPGGPRIIDGFGCKSLHEQSHGESFFALFNNRFRPNSLYLMDEPEAALSPKRQVEFLGILHEYCENGCQFVIATHSPIIMAYPEATIHVFGPEGIRETPYTETEHYLITRGFLSNPQRTMSALFEK